MKMHLKKEEKQFLWNKYLKSGLSADEANFRLAEFVTSLNNLISKLKSQKKSKEHINEKFRQKFEEMIQKIDGMQ